MTERNNLNITILTVDFDLTSERFQSLLRLVSKEKRSRIERYHFYKDAQISLLSDLLVRYEICKRTGLSNWQLLFSANQYGKPYLINDPHVQYNLSHSGTYITLAIDSKTVGIDIEQLKPIDLKIAERFFTKDETEYIYTQENDMLMTSFYEIWTKKESRIKLEGKGLSIPLSSFSVLDLQNGMYNYHRMFTKDNKDIMCHVCSTQTAKPQCQVLNLSDFLALFN